MKKHKGRNPNNFNSSSHRKLITENQRPWNYEIIDSHNQMPFNVSYPAYYGKKVYYVRGGYEAY